MRRACTMLALATLLGMPWRESASAQGAGAGAGAAPVGLLIGQVVERESRTPVGGAAVLVEGTGLGTLTGADGRFRLAGVPAGVRSVRAQALGYATVVRTDVVVRPARATELSLELVPAAVELAGVSSAPDYFPAAAGRTTSSNSFAGEEIRRAPGSAGDVSRILMSLPSLAKVNDQSNALVVRGGSPLENAFYVDGVAIPNINHFPTQGASGGPIGILNVDLIERVDFQAGGFGAEYGDRLSSVMNVVLRDGERDGLHGQASVDFTGFGAGLEGALPAGHGSWIGSVRRSYLDLAVRAFDAGATVAPRYGDYQGKAELSLGPRHTLSALVVAADDHMRTDLTQAVENAMLFFGRQDIVQGTAGVSWRAVWGRQLLSTMSLAYALARFDEDDRETATDLPLLTNRSREATLSLRSTSRLELGRAGTVRFGGEISRVMGSYANAYGAHLDPLGDSVRAADARASLPGVKAGGFLEVTVRSPRRLALTAGARADHSSLTGAGSISPRFSASYRLSDATRLTGAWGIYRQSLPLLILAQTPSAAGLPEPVATHLVVGLEHLVAPDTRLSVEAYTKDYRRLPVDPSQPQLLPVDELYYDYGILTAHPKLVAKGQADARGLEATLQKKLSGRLYALAGAAWSRSRYRGDDGIWRRRVFDNRLLLSAEGGYQVASGWELSGRWVYAGGAPYTPLDERASASAGRAVLDSARVNARRYPAYHSLNLRIDRRWNFARSSLVAYLSAWNAYARRNVAQYYWNAVEGRAAPIYQWGLLPVFGVKFEF